MHKLWKLDTDKWEVREVKGDPAPGNDSEGEPITEGLHFADPAEAWKNLVARAITAMEIGGRAVDRAKSVLRQAEQQAKRDAVNFQHASRNYGLYRARAGLAPTTINADAAPRPELQPAA